MRGRRVDLSTWPRADQFRFFRGFDRPHFATTARVDMTALMAARRDRGLSPFRACLWAFGAGLHAVPELCLRFDAEGAVWAFDRLTLSPTVAMPDGDFRFAYLDWQPDFAAFDAEAAARIDEVRAGVPHNPNEGRLDVAYASCMPWLDYSGLTNAMPGPDDCIPRISWGKIVPKGDGFDCAVTLEVHHALVDGRPVGQWFDAVGRALAGL